ncbi:transcription antitermination factor NusB [Flavobacteriales bacterium]|jgi:transcription antitermination protein NusB|nr:transcription antitermination factor NusB [Flavobacteriales bacterium]MDB3926679.1 transcription antitermination factor NusB [Flavobacteriales bacterium]|tara:strand:+ start:7106 stop:8041 length:936 start_codon:yes stop_codon:yes gene_type:complete
MLNRRHLRIRVLQFVYSWNKSKDTDIVKVEKQFLKSLEKVEELYILLLLILIEVRDFAEDFQEDAKKKKLPSDEDLNPKTKFLDNLFIQKLKDDTSLMSKANELKLSFSDSRSLIKAIYLEIIKTPLYENYISEEETGFDVDKKFILKLFSKHIIDMAALQDFLNEQDIYWDDDLPFVSSMIVKTIKESSDSNTSLFDLFNNKEEKDFALNLLRFSIIHSDEYTELISSKTKNWDIDRVALMDLILMQMALTELLKMPQIPVKVSINEYLELAKYYSTPNSKNFVNGILDNLYIELKRKGLITKTGRGLIE